MGLYLTVFQGDIEAEGVEVGSYADFGLFREMIVLKLEHEAAGSRFPCLILHSDCDGIWTCQECIRLEEELVAIQAEFRELPPIPMTSIGEWQANTVRKLGIGISSLNDCFLDVDGEPLIDRLLQLVRIAQELGEPILFQ